jgi:hypothetical protein
MYGLSAVTTLITISAVGGLPFIIAAVLMGTLYYNGIPTDHLQIDLILICSTQPPKCMGKLLET